MLANKRLGKRPFKIREENGETRNAMKMGRR
jgi:hypothetical protein